MGNVSPEPQPRHFCFLVVVFFHGIGQRFASVVLYPPLEGDVDLEPIADLRFESLSGVCAVPAAVGDDPVPCLSEVHPALGLDACLKRVFDLGHFGHKIGVVHQLGLGVTPC